MMRVTANERLALNFIHNLLFVSSVYDTSMVSLKTHPSIACSPEHFGRRDGNGALGAYILRLWWRHISQVRSTWSLNSSSLSTLCTEIISLSLCRCIRKRNNLCCLYYFHKTHEASKSGSSFAHRNYHRRLGWRNKSSRSRFYAWRHVGDRTQSSQFFGELSMTTLSCTARSYHSNFWNTPFSLSIQRKKVMWMVQPNIELYFQTHGRTVVGNRRLYLKYWRQLRWMISFLGGYLREETFFRVWMS